MKKKYIFLIALVGVFLLGIFRYIDLNSRFPKAPTQAYGLRVDADRESGNMCC